MGMVGDDRRQRLEDGRKDTGSKATMPYRPLRTEIGIEEKRVARV